MAEAKANEAATVPVKPPFNIAASVRGLFFDGRNQLNLKIFNALLAVCVIGLVARFVSIVNGSYARIRAIDFKITSETPGEIREKTVLKKVEYYLEKTAKRDIFKMGALARPENMIEAGPSSKAVEATQNLRLVGISWSEDPDAMVEDIKALKTFFVKKGQSIGDVKVENITKDKIVLKFGQELIELK